MKNNEIAECFEESETFEIIGFLRGIGIRYLIFLNCFSVNSIFL